MSLYKNILSKDTATHLREWVLQRNKALKEEEEIYVIGNENRWSFYIGANEGSIVSKAIHEVAKHKVFRPALEKIVGKNPAIIEMTAITSAYGAEDQFWHHDVISEGSAAKYGRSFIPSYSLFMTLQDTTSAMGATAVCPGTYMCTSHKINDICGEYGFQVSDNGVWEQGDAVFMNQQSIHRGAAHSDPNGSHRVLFIITFAPRPMDIRYETRMIGQGGSYSLKWDMWGHTLHDFEHCETKMRQPWTTLRALGIYKPKDSQWGWDWLSQQSMRLANKDSGYDEVERLDDFVDNGGFGFPKILSVPLLEGMSWRDYFRASIKRCKDFSEKVAMIGSFIFVCVSLFGATIVHIVNKHSGSARTPVKSVFRLYKRIVLYNLVSVALGVFMMDHLARSGWARSIKARTLYSSPFNIPDLKTDPRPVAVVYKTDVLISDRLDFKKLGSLVDALDYQGGNVRFKAAVHGASKMVEHLKKDDMNRLVETILRGLKREGGRLLLQNEASDWVVLDNNDATLYTTQAIMLETNALIAALHKESKFLLSSYKHGLRYKGAMAHKYSPLHINNIMDVLMNNEGIPLLQLYSSPSLLKEKKKIVEITNLAKPTRSTSLRSPRRLTIVAPITSTALRQSTSSLCTNVVISDEGMLVLGDIVEAQYEGMTDYYKGKIISIKEGSSVEVVFDDGDRDTHFEPSDLKKFVPYVVGERVQVKESVDGVYLPAKITRIYPEGRDVLNAVFLDTRRRVKVPSSFVSRVETFEVGEFVEAPFEGSEDYFMATVVNMNADGTIDLHYDDGDESFQVNTRNLRKLYDSQS
jgi:hypothetical protein